LWWPPRWPRRAIHEVLGLGIGCFGELIARNCAVSYVDRYDDKSHNEALGIFRSRIRRVWHAAVFAWSDLIFNRGRKLVGLQSPAACATRAGGESGPDFDNYDLFHTHCVSEHRTRCSRPFVADELGLGNRRQTLVYRVEFEVHLLALLQGGPYGGAKKMLISVHIPRGANLAPT